jgi:hypothetical protein
LSSISDGLAQELDHWLEEAKTASSNQCPT